LYDDAKPLFNEPQSNKPPYKKKWVTQFPSYATRITTTTIKDGVSH